MCQLDHQHLPSFSGLLFWYQSSYCRAGEKDGLKWRASNIRKRVPRQDHASTRPRQKLDPSAKEVSLYHSSPLVDFDPDLGDRPIHVLLHYARYMVSIYSADHADTGIDFVSLYRLAGSVFWANCIIALNGFCWAVAQCEHLACSEP